MYNMNMPNCVPEYLREMEEREMEREMQEDDQREAEEQERQREIEEAYSMDKFLLWGSHGYVEFTIIELINSKYFDGYDDHNDIKLKGYTFDSLRSIVNTPDGNLITYFQDDIF